MREKIFDKLAYVSLFLTIVGQILISFNKIILAQFCFLISNILSISRCFILKKSTADKVKDFGLLGVSFACLSIAL